MNLIASDLISKSLLVVMSLAVILYSLFVGTFLGKSATGFVLIVWDCLSTGPEPRHR